MSEEQVQTGETAPPYTPDAPDTLSGVGGTAPVTSDTLVHVDVPQIEEPQVTGGGETLEQTPPPAPAIEDVKVVTPPQEEIDAHPGEYWNFEHQRWTER